MGSPVPVTHGADEERAVDARRRAELADFLRLRRAAVSPADAGLEVEGRRRTPGLRREEVAQLAGVGLSWYTWLEQGRDIHPSPQVLDAIAGVLQLDAGERGHLFSLARAELPLPAPEAAASPVASAAGSETPEGLAEFVDALAPHPAFLLGPRADILAWNRPAEVIIGTPLRAPDGRQNLLWTLFVRIEEGDPGPSLQTTARNTLARFRVEHARHLGDPSFTGLVDDLVAASPRFAELWSQHEVRAGQYGTKTIDHPALGTLRLRHLQSLPTEHPGLRLTQYVPMDDATRRALAEI